PGRAGTWGPLFIGAYSLCLVTVGIFTPDPDGFPPGVSIPAQTTTHALIHGFGALFAFLTLAAALLVIARGFWERRERGWALYCLLSGVLIVALFFGGFGLSSLTARLLRLGVLFGWGAASLTAIRLLNTSQPVSEGKAVLSEHTGAHV